MFIIINIFLKLKDYIVDLRNYFKKRVLFVWIPSHFGITGNEIANCLARMGTDKPINVSIEVPVSNFRCLFKEESWNNTQCKIIRKATFKRIPRG
jgi:ribonuclease HI